MKKTTRSRDDMQALADALGVARVARAGRGRQSARWYLRFCCAASLISCQIPVWSLNPSTPLADLRTQAWVLENGLPQDTVQALAQSAEGYVWVGTEAGLGRFDGREFRVFDRRSSPALPGVSINCLLATSDGALWIGTEQGLTAWKNGVMTMYSKDNGLPGNGIRALVQTSDGMLWVRTDQGLARMNGSRFEPASGSGLPPEEIKAVFAQGGDSLWVVKTHGLEVYKDGYWTEAAWQNSWPRDGAFTAQQMPDGAIALASNRELVLVHNGQLLKRLTVGKELPGARIQSLFADREGSLWVGTNRGLARIAADKVQVFPSDDVLGKSSVLALMEDREGNLWVGTEAEGVHILRDRRFLIFDGRNGLASDATTTVTEDQAGTLWVGTNGSGLNAVSIRKGDTVGEFFPAPGVVRIYTAKTGLASNVILSLAAAPNGDLWVGTPDGLNRIRRGAIATFTSADGLPDDFIRSLLVDNDGSLWLGTRHGLGHWTQGPGDHMQMKVYTQANGLGSDLVGAMTRDAHGDLWVATLAGLSQLHDGRITNYTTANGLASNVATALFARTDGTLLIGAENHGVDFWDGQRFSSVAAGNQEESAIHAILDDGSGHLWFAMAAGIARCDEIGDGLPGCSHWVEFGTADGLRSQQMATNSHPSAWRSSSGRLWFATGKGLVEAEPSRFLLNALPPPVVLERFAVDDVDQPLRDEGKQLRIPAGHVNFEFDYAGLSFIAPQEVRYRYILQGFDRDWTDAGARRAAYYTNIPSGHYEFRVEAANNDGVWNAGGAQFSFDLQRHFYQTIWFYALMVLVLASCILVFLRLRLRVAEGQFRAVLRERSRIAREIHDTLAQGYVGVSVQLELVAELLRRKKTDDACKQLDETREYVREGLSDARQSIWALRTQDTTDENLPVKLRSMVDRAADADLKAQFNLSGPYRPLHPATERELLRIAQEAIHNVKKHAAAHELSVRLEYGQEMIVLEVRDDGRGGAVRHTSGSAPGHFGITGMQERVEAIGGTLEIDSAPGMGTTICLRLRTSALAPAEERGQALR